MKRPPYFPNTIEKLDGTSEGDLEKYFEMFFGSHRPPFLPAEEGWHPASDMFETEEKIVIVVDIAGISVKDITLVLNKDALIMKGIRDEVSGFGKRQYHKMEVAYGPFERVFRLPSPVCADEVKAEYRDGILTIQMQKREKPLKKRMIINIQ